MALDREKTIRPIHVKYGVAAGGGGGGHTIQEEGAALTQRTGLNFIGAGVTAADNAGSDRTDVTIRPVATDTIWDAKGDLAIGTGADTASKLAVGANGTIPIAASGEATGVRWGGANIDLAGYKAIALACDNGATLPTSPAPTVGQWFLHTPTGRKILMMYDGSAWIPIISLGTMTVYVDNTDGTDSQDKGGAVDSGAFKTIQFAVNQIPGLVGGNVTVNVNGETYYEQVTVQGKNYSGNYTITLTGTLTNSTSGTATAGSATTLTTSLNRTLNQDQYKILRITGGTGSGTSAIILSNTAGPNTVYTVERFATTPDATSQFSVDVPGTVISGATAGAPTTPLRDRGLYVLNGQQAVNMSNVQVQYCATANINYFNTATGTLTHCFANNSTLYGIFVQNYGILTLNTCYAYSNTAYGVMVAAFSSMLFQNDCLYHANGWGIRLLNFSNGNLTRSRTLSNTNDGVKLLNHSRINLSLNSHVSNGGWGCDSSTLSKLEGASAETYSGNVSGTYNAPAASYCVAT